MKKVLLGMLLITVVLSLTGCNKVDMTLMKQTYASDNALLDNQLLKDKYDGQRIEYTGIVEGLQSGVLFEGISIYGAVNCEMDIDSADDVVSHTKITVIGIGEVQENSMLVLTKCKVKEIHDIEVKVDANTDFSDKLSNFNMQVVEITGEISSVNDWGFVLLKQEISTNASGTIPVAFISDYDLSGYSAGDQVVILAVWDGTMFNGSEIKMAN